MCTHPHTHACTHTSPYSLIPHTHTSLSLTHTHHVRSLTHTHHSHTHKSRSLSLTHTSRSLSHTHTSRSLSLTHSNKPGNTLYTQWCTVWEREAGDSIAAGPKMFLVDQYLPIWVQCTVEGCQKWRKLPPSIELHHVKQEIVRCSSCQQPEDEVCWPFD